MCEEHSKAHGWLKGYYDKHKKMLAGYIELLDIKDVTQIHFHIGKHGMNGPVIAWIWPLDTKKITSQPFTTGKWSVPFTITEKDITFSKTSSPRVTNFWHLVQAIKKGEIYVNVHTVKFPEGEIRGQTYKHKEEYKQY